jgi:hypothetical protein
VAKEELGEMTRNTNPKKVATAANHAQNFMRDWNTVRLYDMSNNIDDGHTNRL